MRKTERNSDETAAVERVANAAREVQLASQALKKDFNAEAGAPGRTLPLARRTAAIAELQVARDAFDTLLARNSLH
ncbi:hypothetical protein [Caballeronia hypogeia]|uniref:hypothetical protein n=1 Tax=Caballeronia hypogeia TaxID=1777140 RepID=UPI0007729D58|nr:hypothetical protein [Caballeronia hypogeia]